MYYLNLDGDKVVSISKVYLVGILMRFTGVHVLWHTTYNTEPCTVVNTMTFLPLGSFGQLDGKLI